MGQGTGLGLASVHGIISQSNGYIEVVSALGQGTTFQIYLPRFYPPPVSKKSIEFEGEISAERINILVVEDEELVRDLIVRTLLEAGYSVLATDNHGEALEILQSNPTAIQLLVTDIVMPGELQVQHFVEQTRSRFPEIKILFISGYSDDIVGVKSGVISPSNLLKKPFSMSTLLQKVRHQVSGLQSSHPVKKPG
jgi:CheY-like chemotaxis protein